jgi:type II secretory pathway component GspD/PulD (secretin)
MNRLTKILVVAIGFGLGLTTQAGTFETHRSIEVTTFELEDGLAKKVIPAIRTLISKQGHLASVEGTNKIVVAAKPETLDVLGKVFSKLTTNNFDQQQLRQQVNQLLKKDAQSRMVKRTIQLNNIQSKSLITAIRSLVSFEGSLKENKKTNQIEIIDLPKYVDGIEALIKQLDS